MKPSSFNSELERAVFLACYRSSAQRLRRLLARTVIFAKHCVRGLFYIWPSYLLIFGVLAVPATRAYAIYLLALVPGLLVWLGIFWSAAKLEYARRVRGRLLDNTALYRLVWRP